MVTAFVSEATRQMAHNLDDLYQRWEMQYEKARLEGVIEKPRMWHQLQSEDEIPETRTALKLQKTMLVMQLTEMKGGKRWTREDRQHRAVLVAQVGYVDACIAWLNVIEKQINEQRRKENAERVIERDVDESYPAIFAIYQQLRALFWFYGYPESAQPLFAAFDAYLSLYPQYEQDKDSYGYRKLNA